MPQKAINEKLYLNIMHHTEANVVTDYWMNEINNYLDEVDKPKGNNTFNMLFDANVGKKPERNLEALKQDIKELAYNTILEHQDEKYNISSSNYKGFKNKFIEILEKHSIPVEKFPERNVVFQNGLVEYLDTARSKGNDVYFEVIFGTQKKVNNTIAKMNIQENEAIERLKLLTANDASPERRIKVQEMYTDYYDKRRQILLDYKPMAEYNDANLKIFYDYLEAKGYSENELKDDVLEDFEEFYNKSLEDDIDPIE